MEDFTNDWKNVFEDRDVKKKVSDYNTLHEKSCNNSIKPVAVSKKKMPSKKIDHTQIKQRLTAALVGLSIGITATTGVVHTIKNSNHQKINDAANILISMAEKDLAYNNLGTFENDEFIIGNNSVEDYQKLNLDTPFDVWVYGCAAADSTEIEKITQSATYDNGAYHYTGTKQMYNIEGYTSAEEFLNYQEAKALQMLEDGTIYSYDNDLSYTTDLEKGGISR